MTPATASGDNLDANLDLSVTGTYTLNVWMREDGLRIDRLQNAFDFDTGTTSYLYDNNGNLTLIIPPGGAEWLHYGFDQRNLMISHTVSISGTNPQEVAAFVYDGNGDRVQQTDSSGSQPVTTTYINDVVGLTQVLVADDGTQQVYNLFGLDLIGQDEGGSTRYLLADGLGSVRTEMVDGAVESVTTYDPYGNLLQQTGDTGTTYGYTGEQQDSSTGLLYLRARYYNPALRSFMGRDPWSGNMEGPQSMNGWNYVNSSPTNLVDPTGMIPSEFPEHCHAAGSILEYERCVRQEMELEGPSTTFDEVSREFRFHHVNVPEQLRGCYFGPVPYKAPGYLEGVSGELGPANVGIEIVYDFATMEKQNFWYWAGVYSGNAAINAIGKTGNWIENYMGASISGSVGYVKGFRNWHDITRDYEGIFAVYGGQLGMSTISPLSIGATVFHGVPDYGIRGHGFSLSLSLSLGKVNPFASPFSASASMLLATYYPIGTSKPYWVYGRGRAKEVIPAFVSADILAGVRSPLSAAMLVAGGLAFSGIGTPHAIGFITASVTARGIGAYQGYQWSKTYNAIHSDSWGPWENWLYRVH